MFVAVTSPAADFRGLFISSFNHPFIRSQFVSASVVNFSYIITYFDKYNSDFLDQIVAYSNSQLTPRSRFLSQILQYVESTRYRPSLPHMDLHQLPKFSNFWEVLVNTDLALLQTRDHENLHPVEWTTIRGMDLILVWCHLFLPSDCPPVSSAENLKEAYSLSFRTSIFSFSRLYFFKILLLLYCLWCRCRVGFRFLHASSCLRLGFLAKLVKSVRIQRVAVNFFPNLAAYWSFILFILIILFVSNRIIKPRLRKIEAKDL